MGLLYVIQTTDHTDELDAAPSKGKGKRKRRNSKKTCLNLNSAFP